MNEPILLWLTADEWNAIAAWITAIVTLWIAYMAWSAFDTWKHQVDRDHKRDTGRRLIRQAIELRDTIEMFRLGSLNRNTVEERSEEQPYGYARMLEDILRSRWQPLSDKFASFEIALAEARTLHLESDLESAKELLELRKTFVCAINDLLTFYTPTTADEQREEIKKRIVDVYSTLAVLKQEDELTKKTEKLCLDLIEIIKKASER